MPTYLVFYEMIDVQGSDEVDGIEKNQELKKTTCTIEYSHLRKTIGKHYQIVERKQNSKSPRESLYFIRNWLFLSKMLIHLKCDRN